MADYSGMTIEKLEEIKAKMNRQRDNLTAELRLVAGVIDEKLAEKAAAEKVANMSYAEKKAVAQAIQAEGIESGEAVGTPGRK